MEKTKHCVLCKLSKSRFKDGLYCSLTDEKPDFTKTCPKIEFGASLFKTVESTNIEFEKIKRTKILNYVHFVTFIIISFLIFLLVYFMWDYFFYKTNNLGTVITFGLPIIIIAIGVYTMSIAFGYLNAFKNNLSIATAKKQHIDSILNMYDIEYDIHMTYGKKYHGTQDIDVDLKFKDHILIKQ